MRSTIHTLALAVLSLCTVSARASFPFPKLGTGSGHKSEIHTAVAVETLIIERTPTPPAHVMPSAPPEVSISVVTVHDTVSVVHAVTETVHVTAHPQTVEALSTQVVHVTIKETEPAKTVTEVEVSAQTHVVPTTLVHVSLAPTTIIQNQIHTQLQTVESRVVETKVEVQVETAKETVHQVQIHTIATTAISVQTAAPVTIQSIERQTEIIHNIQTETEVLHQVQTQTVATTVVPIVAPVTVKSIQTETALVHVTQEVAPVTVERTQVSIQKQTEVVHNVQIQTAAPEITTLKETVHIVQTAAPQVQISVQKETETVHLVETAAPQIIHSIQRETVLSLQKETETVHNVQIQTQVATVPVLSVEKETETVHVVQTAAPQVIHSIQRETVLSLQKETETVHNVQIQTRVATVPVLSVEKETETVHVVQTAAPQIVHSIQKETVLSLQKETVHVVQTAAPQVIHSIQTATVHAISTVVSTAVEAIAGVEPTSSSSIVHHVPFSPPVHHLSPATTIHNITSPPAHTLPAAAAAQTHTVIVGGDAGLVYTPPSISAAVGDKVRFIFMATNHTVTQSLFNSPCQSFPGSLDSGYWANPNNTVVPPPQWDVTVQTTDPTWWFCAQGAHCNKGMVFAINPTVEKSFELFRAIAIGDVIPEGGATGTIGGGSASATVAPELSSMDSSLPAATLSAEGAVSSKVVDIIGAPAGGTEGSCQCQCLCPSGSWQQAPLLQASASPSSMLRALPVPSTFITSTTRRGSESLPSSISGSAPTDLSAPSMEPPPAIAERLQAPVVTVSAGNARARLATPSPNPGGVNLGTFTDLKSSWTIPFAPPPP